MSQHLIAYQYDTDKSQLYLDNYERHFGSLVDRDTNLLELGINEGGSLFMWRDYFCRGKIVGLDINQVSIDDPTGRIHVYQGDQRDLGLLDRIGVDCAPDGFDIIIDDASHIAEFTKASFWHLFEHHLKPGGAYVIEDWRVGYWEAWDDGARYRPPGATRVWPHRLSPKPRPRSTFPSHDYGLVGFTKQLMDELGMDAITNPARGAPPPQRLPRFRRMEICPGQVFIVKATKQDHDRVREQWRGPAGHS
jgi:SAM-dependent methyltransferase